MNILKNRKIYFIISGVLLLISLYILFFSKLNLGIDMTGGINLDYSFTKNLDIEKIKNSLLQERKNIRYKDGEIINNIGAYTVTGEKTLSIVVGFVNSLDEKVLDEKKLEFRKKVLSILKTYDSSIEETKYTNIGKSFGDYIKNTAFFTLILATLAISFYIYYAFSGTISGISPIYFGVITFFALVHDIIVSSGLYILVSNIFTEFQVDTFFITALLTILGYSINDTIVVFDRLRGNLKRFGGKKGKDGKDLKEIVDLSINQTIKRSIYTSLTLVFVLITMFLFGPENLKGFILVMIFGTFIGTYSSVFLAAPLLYELNKNKKLEVYKKKELRIEDKIVV